MQNERCLRWSKLVWPGMILGPCISRVFEPLIIAALANELAPS
jgi:hypothetical protein